MSSIIEGMVNSYQKNKEYGERLLSDLSEDQMMIQPDGDRELPCNHPAWTMSHMNLYLPVIGCMIRGESFEDTKGHQFGQLSKPEATVGLYPSKDALLNEWSEGHTRICDLLGDCDNSVFDQPIHQERWAQVMGSVGKSLPYLMLNHENMHLGQISAWRRVLGLPSV